MPAPPTARRNLAAGSRAEEIAARFLETNGLSIVARNWRCRCGEIDLVARDQDTLVFVEVRLRRRADFGGAAESITRSKRERVISAAQLYLARLRQTPPCRFDAVLLEALDSASIEWIRDAFGA